MTPNMDMRYDKDGYAIHPYITKMDLKTFELLSVLNPKYKPESEGGEEAYEYILMGVDYEEIRKHLAKGKTNIG